MRWRNRGIPGQVDHGAGARGPGPGVSPLVLLRFWRAAVTYDTYRPPTLMGMAAAFVPLELTAA